LSDQSTEGTVLLCCVVYVFHIRAEYP
jgi:hypothetical protein